MRTQAEESASKCLTGAEHPELGSVNEFGIPT